MRGERGAGTVKVQGVGSAVQQHLFLCNQQDLIVGAPNDVQRFFNHFRPFIVLALGKNLRISGNF